MKGGSILHIFKIKFRCRKTIKEYGSGKGGFVAVSIKNLDPDLMPRTPLRQMYHLTKEVLNPAADAIFVSCTGLGIAHGINMMERDFGLPVVTSNQASLWGALRSLSIKDDVGLGKLFTL